MSRSVQVLLAAGLLGALSSTAFAAKGDVAGREAASSAELSVEAATTPHRLQKTWFNTANPGSAVAAATYVPLTGPLTITCGTAAGCTVYGNFLAQFAATAVENAVAVCMKVDGVLQACPYNKIIREGSGYEVANYQYFTSVPAGAHTVEAVIYANAATTLQRWVTEVQLYSLP